MIAWHEIEWTSFWVGWIYSSLCISLTVLIARYFGLA